MSQIEWNKWLVTLRSLFEEVSVDTGLPHSFDTHHDAQNFVFSIASNNLILRLDFQPLGNSKIQVTKIRETYPFFPSFFIFIHNFFPFAPSFTKTAIENIEVLQPPYENMTFKNHVSELLHSALSLPH